MTAGIAVFGAVSTNLAAWLRRSDDPAESRDGLLERIQALTAAIADLSGGNAETAGLTGGPCLGG